jgi:phosphomethylpyrimidine synthase
MFKQSLIKQVAKKEKVNPLFLERQLKNGRVVIPLNKKRALLKTLAIGEGLKVKINTNLGTSTNKPTLGDELKKLKVANFYGTDTIMDLSTGGNLRKIRLAILSSSPVPVGTVPIYEAAKEVERRRGSFEKMSFDDFWDVLKSQAEDGVDFFTLHVGILKNFLEILKKNKRVGGIVSRGGAILARMMHINKRENMLYANFDRIINLAKEYNITISLGDALRPGAIADSSDELQFAELKILGQLVKKCRRAEVQVIVEGPGHIRFNEIEFNVKLQKKLCHRAPFYVLGPLTTDIAAGYDHITAAIGGTLAAFSGADFLCVVTPAEHLRHPSIEDIREGVIAAKISAHSVDILRFKDEAMRDYQLSLSRSRRDWNKLFALVLDKQKALKYRENLKLTKDLCTMCGDFCSLKIIEKCNFLR